MDEYIKKEKALEIIRELQGKESMKILWRKTNIISIRKIKPNIS